MKKYSVVFVVCISMFIFSLNTSMMNVSITDLCQDFNTEIKYVQLAITLYALVIAAFILLGAKLSSIYGAKRIFMIGVSVFAIGMLTSSLSQNIAMLTIGWSVIAGFGAALIVPTGVSLIVQNYEGRARAVAFAIFAAVYVGSAAIGPLIGGAFTTYLSWRWAFFSLLGLDVIILILSPLVKSRKGTQKAKVDVIGVLLSAAGFFSVSFGVIATTPAIWITGVILLLLFVLWERRQEKKGREPLLPFSLIKDGHYMAGVGVAGITNVSLGALFFSIPLFVQSVLSFNAMESGIILMPLTIALMMMAFITPRLAAKIKAKYLSIIGIALGAIGAVLLANSFSADMAATDMIPGLVVYGLGIGLATSQLQNLTLSSIEASETDEGAGLFNGMRNLGWSLGTSIVGTLLITFLLSGLVTGINDSNVLSQEEKDALTAVVTKNTVEMSRDEIAAEAEDMLGHYPPEYAEEIKAIGADVIGHSMRVTFYIIVGIHGGCLIVCFFLPRRKLVSTDSDATIPK